MEIVRIDNFSQLDALEKDWSRLAKKGVYFVPRFADLRDAIAGSKTKFQLLTAIDNSQMIACACFIYVDTMKSYEIAWKTLFRLPVKMVVLFGGCVIGDPSEDVIRRLFEVIIGEGDFDLLSVGNIFRESPLYKAVTALPNTFTWTGWRKERRWWLIQLPASFDEYIASMREKARMHIARDCRRFERHNPEFRIMQLPEDVDHFLRDAEKISRSTYHWSFDGVHNDESTRQRFIELATSGNLRCYISYINGVPSAFGWGELVFRRFMFRQTGYDPQFQRLSPGTALMMRLIRDLIENTDCQVVDFLWGGTDGYKPRLANISFPCVSVQVAVLSKPYSLLIGALDLVLNLVKRLMAQVIERGPLQRFSRKRRRQHGMATF